MDDNRLITYISDLLEQDPFATNQKEKMRIYARLMPIVHQHHLLKCLPYRNIWEHFQCETDERMGALPVSLFKQSLLVSVAEKDIYKMLTSSGTTGSIPSRVPLDRQTAEFQQKALAKITTSFIGRKRMPMLVIDHEQILRGKNQYSARAAGILGFSIYASRKCFALNEKMELDLKKVQDFLARFQGEKILIFGFTYLVWQTLYLQLRAKGKTLDLSNAILIHGGGWKRLRDQMVSEEIFREGLDQTCHLNKISNYYGMAEQTGGIYIECEYHHFHASLYSEIVIRNMQDFSPCQIGEEGIVQVMTPLALSYPGHNLLTEDKGILLGIDACPCGRKGKYFKLTGRMRRAEIRGCSDVYAEQAIVGES